jgi:pimeloyl-ACP methyl ester carboxylesterase
MRNFLKVLLVAAVVIAAGLGYWRYDHDDRESKAAQQALAALDSDDIVTVTQDDWIVFTPTGSNPTKGLIFYPGGEVDERGYSEPLRAIAAAGYLVVMPPMPLQLAVFDIDAAADVIAAYPDIQAWGIAGHSLGGSMGARYVFNNPGVIDGLLLWDSYAPDDMSAVTIRVRMIHRSDDSGEPPADYEPKLVLLPPQTDFIPLIGGQHLNFGNFIAGRMYRDAPPADLDAATQRAMVAAASIQFMDSL